MKTIPIAVPTGTNYRARISAAKNTISVSSIVGKILRKSRSKPLPAPFPLFLFSDCETVDPAKSTTWGPRFRSPTVSQFPEHASPAGHTESCASGPTFGCALQTRSLLFLGPGSPYAALKHESRWLRTALNGPVPTAGLAPQFARSIRTCGSWQTPGRCVPSRLPPCPATTCALTGSR